MFPSFSRLSAITFLIAGLPLLAQAAPLSITIEHIAKPTGTIQLGVYTAEGYDGGGAVFGAQITVDAATATTVIEGLEPGTYAIKLFHDVDDNGSMKTGFMGIPKEPYAFSNNARGKMGPANWSDAQFTVTADGAVQVISLN